MVSRGCPVRRSRSVLLAAAAGFLLSCSSGGGDSPSTVAAPTFLPDPTYAFGEPLAVTLSTATEGAAIHYTTDGNEPTSASATYTEPISLTETTTIRAMAARPGATDSAVASATYVHRPVGLALDEGSGFDGMSPSSQEYLALNRYTPAAGAFPFLLRWISVYFNLEAPPEGTPIELVVLTDDDGDPTNGASLVLVHRTTVLFQYWSVFELPEPALLDGPGDVLVGVVVPPLTFVGFGDVQSGGSWLVYWPTVEAPEPLSLPAARGFMPIQGNWAIRAWN